MSGGGSRVSIPNNMKKMIQNIKEITCNHSEEEIYAMLKECSMDPNETTQKLLFQVYMCCSADPFHEVRRKRDRRKENENTREPVESRWRPGSQGRGSRGARGDFSSCYTSHELGAAGTSQVPDKGVGPSLPTSDDTKDKETTPAAR